MGRDDRWRRCGVSTIRRAPARSNRGHRVRGRTAGSPPEVGRRRAARRDASQTRHARSGLSCASVAWRVSHEGRMHHATRDVRTTMGLGDDRSVTGVGRSPYHRVRDEAARNPNESAELHGRLGRSLDERLMAMFRSVRGARAACSRPSCISLRSGPPVRHECDAVAARIHGESRDALHPRCGEIGDLAPAVA